MILFIKTTKAKKMLVSEKAIDKVYIVDFDKLIFR